MCTTKHACAALFAAITALACGCSHKAPTASQAPVAPTIDTAAIASFGGDEWVAQKIANEKNVSVDGGGSFAHVTYKSTVKVVDKADIDASLQGISSDGNGAVFENAGPMIRALQSGDVVLVKNGFAAKVIATETTGSQTVLILDQAKIADVVEQGEIKLEPTVSFHGPARIGANTASRSATPLLDLLISPAQAQPAPTYKPLPGAGNVYSGIKLQGEQALIDGWKVVSWSVTPADRVALISTRLTKDTSGFKAAVSMDGEITDFQLISDLKIPMPANTLATGLRQLSGKMHFVWEIGKDTPGVWAAEDRLRLPAGISIPLGSVLDGLPLSLDISAAFLIHPALTGGNEYSKGGFSITWVGSKSQLAKTFNDELDPNGSIGLTFEITDDANVSPVAPTGMVISFCAPRVELKFGLLGSYGSASNRVMKTTAKAIDFIVETLEKKMLSPSAYAALAAAPRMTASAVLSSSADLYAQVIHTSGVTHSSNLSLTPCSKVELKVTGQIGGDVQLFNLTNGMRKTIDTFSKTYTRWDPASDFCKSV